MNTQTIYHALVLNLHQPAGNLEHLLENNTWEAKEILWSLDHMPRALWNYEDIARVHLSLSGTLLETLASPDFQERVYGIVKCGELLWYLQNSNIFQILGTGYYHPVLPLIPTADRADHLQRWQHLAKHIFWRDSFSGFWPPEMGFCMELIPLLKQYGYRYVLVDSAHVEPLTPMEWPELRYRPHVAEYQGEEIIVIVRDRELSDAQESGMDFTWFQHEIHERTQYCDFPPLVTTCTDGDNGGWFRNTDPHSNFWDAFYATFMQAVQQNRTVIRPTFIDDYLNQHGAHGYVTVNRGAWNTGWHDGLDLVQWTGSTAQKIALQRVHETSAMFHEICHQAGPYPEDGEVRYKLGEAHWHLLRAETSCHFFWGEAWVERCHADLDWVWLNIDAVRNLL